MLLNPAINISFLIEQRYEILISEPMYSFNKKSLMITTEKFCKSTINEKNTIFKLARLIYLINNGVLFYDYEKEQIYFSVSKLFQWQRPELRRMMYKIIKMVMPASSKQIIVSSIRNDIISTNYYLKIYGIRMIAFVFDTYNFYQLEKLVQIAITDNDEQISVQGLLVGFHISSKFPKIITNWSQEIVIILNKKCLNNNFHALILYKKLKENDQQGLIYMLKQMIQQQLIPLIIMQVIKFIQFLIQDRKNRDQNIYDQLIIYEFQQYLLDQIYYQVEVIVTIQTIKAIIGIKQISSIQFRLAVDKIFSIIDHQTNTIQTFAALKILNKIILQLINQNLITQQMKDKIQTCIFSTHISISCYAISLYIPMNYKQSDQYFIQMFKLNYQSNLQYNYLCGLFEFLSIYKYDGVQILNMVETIIKQKIDEDLIQQVFMIVELLLKDQIIFQAFCLSLLFQIRQQSKDQKYKLYLIKIVYYYILRIDEFKSEDEQIISYFEQVQLCFHQAKQKCSLKKENDQNTEKENFLNKQYQDNFIKQFRILLRNLNLEI